MSTKWTTEQEKAISVRNCNTLVSAAAGSGKTAVLVQRVIDIVTDETNPVYINRLLIATFTNAAASEMKERIYRALQEKIKNNPDNSFLREQLVLLGQAQISTIHSFCMNLIRENFHLLGIRHDFDIADDVKLSAMKKLALEETLEEAYIEGNPEFLKTVDSFGGKRNDDMLSEIILTVYDFAESLSDPDKWLDECVDNLKSGELLDIYRKYINSTVSQVLSHIITSYEAALETIEADGDLQGYYSIFSYEYEMFKEMLEKNDEATKKKAAVFSFSRLSGKGKNADPENVSYVQGIRDREKKSFNKIYDLYMYSDEEIISEINEILPYVKTVCTLVKNFKFRFSQMKLSENILEFSDLEHYAIRLLAENEDVRNHLKDFYTEILVDEYQETNGVQAYLFELLSNGKNLFMVGDVKQSIYGFRNSNPRYFIEKYNYYGFEDNGNGTKINLAKNFRSCNKVICTVNMIFEKYMPEELGGVTYNEEHMLVYGNSQIKDMDCPVERYIINTAKTKDAPENPEIDKVQAEAIFIANRIYKLVEVEKPQIYDKNRDCYRSVTYKDIAVLMHKTKNIASVYADIFAHRGIPVYTAEAGGYFNCIEIATVLSFLKVLENPLQDISLLAVMRSPVFGFDDNHIANIRSVNKKTHFYNLLKKSDDEKVIDFVNYIEDLMSYSKYNNVGAVVRKIVYDTGYYHFVGGLSNGNVRMMNLNLLCERANSFCKNGFKDVSSFISYVNSMLESGNEYKAPKLISESENVVNIMSIHKSKGLEFPVVFLAETGLNFNKTDMSKPVVFDEKLGLVTDIVDAKRHLKYVPYVKRAVCEKKVDELIAEEIRLLYVAMTRAKYKLIISGSFPLKDEIIDNNALSAYEIKLKKNYLEMLMGKITGLPDAKIYSIQHILDSDISCCKKEEKAQEFDDYSEFYDKIAEKLDFTYPYKESRFIPSKKSISEVVSQDDDISLNKISFEDKGISSAQRGTLVHFVLQNIDLENVATREAVAGQIDDMIKRGIFDGEYRGVIDVNAIYDFFVSDVGRRMLSSDKIYREFRFCVDVCANDLGYDSIDEKILVQGVIDCCFEENGKFVIIDYKTGSLKDKYKNQVELYKKCLEISTGKSVAETIIYPLI